VVFIDRAPGVDARGLGAWRSRHLLGILHFYDLDAQGAKVYHHYFFKMQPLAPFALCSISQEIPLQSMRSAGAFAQHVQYASGLLYEPELGRVVVSYGAADRHSRLLTMSLMEVESLFAGRQDRCFQERGGNKLGTTFTSLRLIT
jgi:hypothetical protein